jgi:hypothetical protein
MNVKKTLSGISLGLSVLMAGLTFIKSETRASIFMILTIFAAIIFYIASLEDKEKYEIREGIFLPIPKTKLSS